MAETITTECPECNKRVTVKAELEGKKIRCKECEHVFPVKTSGKAKVKAEKPKAAPPKEEPKQPAKPSAKHGDDEEEGANPYGLTHLDLSPRCPDCAHALESEDDVICVNCGFNLKTREKKKTKRVEVTTADERMFWLLPGILCALMVPMTIGYCYFHHAHLPLLIYKEDDWNEVMKKYDHVVTQRAQAPFEEKLNLIALIFHPAVELLLLLTALWTIYKCTRMAIDRLIMHPSPPEKSKEK